MRTLPSHAVEAYLAARALPCLPAHFEEAVTQAGVACGRRVEIDVDRLSVLAGTGDETHALVAGLWDWWVECEALWAVARTGDVAGRTWMRTSRPLVSARQSTSKGAKADLGELFDAASSVPGLGELVWEATGAEVDVQTLRHSAAALGGTVRADDDLTALRVEVSLSGTLLYPQALGGPLWSGEVLRRVGLEVRRAAWRDRRVRRLASVDVSVEELWAGLPAPAAA